MFLFFILPLVLSAIAAADIKKRPIVIQLEQDHSANTSDADLVRSLQLNYTSNQTILDKRDTRLGNVEPINQQDNGYDGYYGIVEIGTPPQKFKLCLETAYFQTWVAGIECKDSCKDKTLYDQSKSTSKVPVYVTYPVPTTNPKPFQFYSMIGNKLYDRFDGKGKYYKETVSIDGLSVEKFQIGVMESLEVGFTKRSYDGILGLAPRQHTMGKFVNELGFLEKLVIDGVVPENKFAIYFARNSHQNRKSKDKSELILGGSDPKRESKLKYYNLVDFKEIYNHWRIRLQQVKVNNEIVAKPSDAYIYTGHSLTSGPAAQVNVLYGKVHSDATETKVNGEYTLPCNTMAEVGFVFDEVEYKMLPEDLIRQNFGSKTTKCTGTIVDSDSPMAVSWMIG